MDSSTRTPEQNAKRRTAFSERQTLLMASPGANSVCMDVQTGAFRMCMLRQTSIKRVQIKN